MPTPPPPAGGGAPGQIRTVTAATGAQLAAFAADPSVGTIVLSSGIVLDRAALRVTRPLAIEGPSAACPSGPTLRGLCALDARWLSRHFSIVSGGALTLRNVGLLAGRNAGAGGCVFVSAGASLTAVGVNFASCISVGAGGAILAAGDGASVALSGCFFELCTSRLSFGGAVAGWLGANVTLSGTNFSRCSAGGSGGAVATQLGAVLSAEGVAVSRCTASGVGGGIALLASDGAVSRSRFEDLRALKGGGSIYVYNGTFSLSDSTFARTSCGGTAAYGGGGALGAVYSTLELRGCAFENATSTFNGGAVSLFVSAADVANSTFARSAVLGPLGVGGGVSSRQAAYPRLTSAWCQTHAAVCISPDLQISGSSFSDNSASGSASAQRPASLPPPLF